MGEIPRNVRFTPRRVRTVHRRLQCNADSQLTAADDVFDYAELCWYLAHVAGWEGKAIAAELRWNNAARVTQHKDIKEHLHPRAWTLARAELTRSAAVVNNDDDDRVNQELTQVNWTEKAFRAFLSHLPCPLGDRAAMRSQVRAITELLSKPDKLTAKVAGAAAERHAWHMRLARLMDEVLVADVPLSERKLLLKDVRQNVYGKVESPRDLERFDETLKALNEKALGIKLYHADALQWLPTQEEKSIALVVTDPPYNTTEHSWDQKGTHDEFLGWMREWLTVLRPKLKEEYHLFVFCDPDYFAPLEMLLKADGWPLKSRLIWEYRNLVKGRDVTDKFIENYQVCLHCGTHALNWPPEWDKGRFMVQEYATPQSNFAEGRHHPTSKPVGLIKHLVQLGSKAGDVVLDMFAGGGTTGQACAETKQRRCVLVEIEDALCTVIEERLKIKRVAL
jgi:16S rRNA G966 N2-methylase RsmD